MFIITTVFIFLLFIILVFFLFVEEKGEDSTDVDETDLIDYSQIVEIINPLDNTLFFWENSDFTRNNWPDPYYDIEEKQFIFEKCKFNKPKHGIIDVGAHIGDLAIPLALALSHIGRHDIIVYAIDPSKEKCDFIKKMAKINSIENIRILNYGLSDSEQIMGHGANDANLMNMNTGGQRWEKKINDSVEYNKTTYDDERALFVTADSLFLKKEIGPVGIYHIDVEGHEIELLNGSKTLIDEFKPLILIESFVDILSKDNNKDNSKCKSKEECPDLFNLLDNISYNLSGSLPNGDLFFSPKNI
jgi:FkbM family methyltransferase